MAYATKFKQPDVKSIKFKGYKGCDFSNSPLNVEKYRAIDGRNFINENGVNHKRHGANEVVNFAGGFSVNGIWQFEDTCGELRRTAYHCA